MALALRCGYEAERKIMRAFAIRLKWCYPTCRHESDKVTPLSKDVTAGDGRGAG
jgi:hypothetical protein